MGEGGGEKVGRDGGREKGEYGKIRSREGGYFLAHYLISHALD